MGTDNAPGVAQALRLLGSAYRHDWSDFDGRGLRDELNELADALGHSERFNVARWAASHSICTTTRAWAEHCPDKEPLPEDHPARERGATHYLNDCVHISAILDGPGQPS